MRINKLFALAFICFLLFFIFHYLVGNYMEATDAEVLSFFFFVLGIVIIVIREILEPPEYDSKRRAKSSYHWEYMRHKEMLGVGRKHKE